MDIPPWSEEEPSSPVSMKPQVKVPMRWFLSCPDTKSSSSSAVLDHVEHEVFAPLQESKNEYGEEVPFSLSLDGVVNPKVGIAIFSKEPLCG
ncbi:hypothetical protein [Nocardiopsis sp. ATB16-24]|uniref:hypothetical protein n=1 Tax=Nocardiopsis sp. ATB16-24 TaxID=3019555 RepID=UPI00255756BB|nr:hypothetical protein [Nocardiopsis sp. ATB16-24]